MPDTTTLTDLLRRIKSLPQLPQALTELLQALRNEALPAQHYIALIERDQTLAASALRLANSAFYGVPRSVGSIDEAVQVLGLRTICGVLAAAALHDALRADACPEFDAEAHRHHAVTAALAARSLAPLAGCDPDEAYLAGLLQNLGRMVLAALVPQAAAQAQRLAREPGGDERAAQLDVIGMAHPHAAALVAESWHFPPAIVGALEAQREPLPDGSRLPLKLAVLVQLADEAAVAACAASAAVALQPEAAALCRRIGLDAAKQTELLEQLRSRAQETLERLQTV